VARVRLSRVKEDSYFTVDSRAAESLSIGRDAPPVGLLRKLLRVLLVLLLLAYAGLSVFRAVQQIVWLVSDPLKTDNTLFNQLKIFLNIIVRDTTRVFESWIRIYLTARTGFITASAALAVFTAIGTVCFLFGARKPLHIALRLQAWAWCVQACVDLLITGAVGYFAAVLRVSASNLGVIAGVGIGLTLTHLITSRFFTHVRKLPSVGGRTRFPERAARGVHWSAPAVVLLLMLPIILAKLQGTLFSWLGDLVKGLTELTYTATGMLEDLRIALGKGFTGAESMYLVDDMRIIAGAATCFMVYVLCFGLPRLYPQPMRPIAGRRGSKNDDPTARGEAPKKLKEPMKIATMRPTGKVFNGDEKKDEGRKPWGHGLY